MANKKKWDISPDRIQELQSYRTAFYAYQKALHHMNVAERRAALDSLQRMHQTLGVRGVELDWIFEVGEGHEEKHVAGGQNGRP